METKAIEKFVKLCEMEKFTKEEMADIGYLADKIEIWLDNEFITVDEAAILKGYIQRPKGLAMVKVEIIENDGLKDLGVNAVQHIEREAQFMFLDYTENLDGGVYLVREDTWFYAERELRAYNIECKVISNHQLV